MINKLKEIFFASGSVKKVVFKNFMWLGVSQMGSRIIRAAITIYSARALGAEGYGIFSYALGLAGFFIMFKNIGVDSIMTRDIAKDSKSRDQIFSTGFWIEICLLVVTALLLLFVAPLFSKISAAITLLPIIAIMLIADDLRDFFIAFFRGVEKMEWEALIVTTANVLVTIFGFVALTYSRTPISLAISYTSASLLVTIITGAIIFWRYGLGVVKNFTGKLVKPILISAWPIAISGLLSIFLFNIDLIMLGWWRTVSEVGIYSAAQKIIGILTIFSGLIGTSTFPVFSRFAHQEDKEKIRVLVEGAFKIMFAFCIPVVVGGVILGSSLLPYIFGGGYSSGGGAFIVLLFSILAIYPLVILSNYVFAHDKQRKTVLFPLVGAISNVVLNFLLVPSYGMIGASCATVFSFFIYTFLMYKFAKTMGHFRFFPNPQKILLAAFIMCIGVVAMKMFNIHLVVNIVISAGVYITSLFLLKEEAVFEVLGLFKK